MINLVSKIRKKEFQALINIKKLDGICVFFWAITNILISSITFSIYNNHEPS